MIIIVINILSIVIFCIYIFIKLLLKMIASDRRSPKSQITVYPLGQISNKMCKDYFKARNPGHF